MLGTRGSLRHCLESCSKPNLIPGLSPWDWSLPGLAELAEHFRLRLSLAAGQRQPRGRVLLVHLLSTFVSFWLPVCQNCIEVDAPTISGIVVADVVATIFLAVAVYCITGQDKGRMSRGEGRAPLAAHRWGREVPGHL